MPDTPRGVQPVGTPDAVRVRITGGTYFIGLLVFLLLIQTCGISNRLDRILERLPERAEAAR